MSASRQRPALLEAAAETETPYGGRVPVWSPVSLVWVELKLSPAGGSGDGEHPPALLQPATAVARDHPAAAAGQRLTLAGEPAFAVREVRRAEPEPGRMTLILDRLL